MEGRSNRPQLTISLLVSNRPDSVRKCLDSLRPIMEQIPSELILVDTSKNPQIHNILWEYTDQVYEFEWCDDFSKARNVGLKKARGEWFLFLDDDEWFVEIDELVQFFRSGEYKNYGYAHYQVRNFYDPSYTYYSDSWVSRMIRIDADTEFRSKIHEYMYPVRGDYKYIYAKAYHSGYIFATEEEKRAHFERNSKLLLKMIEEEPMNLRWKIQMAQEYRSVKELDVLCKFCESCLEEMKDMKSANDAIHLGTFYAAYTEALLLQKNYEKAKEISRRTLEDGRNTMLCRAFVELALAEVAFHEDAWSEAEQHITEYFEIQKTISRDKSEWEEMNRALIVQEAYDDISVKKAYSILISCDLKLRNSVKCLEQNYSKLEWDKDVIYAFLGVEKVLVWAMATMDYVPLFGKIVQDGYRNASLRTYMCQAAQEWSGRDDAFYKVMHVFAQVDVEDWYIWYAKLLDADYQKDKTAVKKALKGFLDTVQNIFHIPKRIYKIAEAYQVEICEYWGKISPDRWKTSVKEYARTAEKEHLVHTRESIENTFEKENWRYQYFQLAVLERYVVRGPETPDALIEHVQRLKTFADETLDFYGNYYKNNVFRETQILLPAEVKAAIKIMEFIEVEQQDKARGLACLKEAAVCYPIVANGIKKFLKQYPELERQRTRKKKEELLKLRNQILAQVKTMLEAGQAEQAIAVLGQLKQMVPNDLEVVALSLEARLIALETKK